MKKKRDKTVTPSSGNHYKKYSREWMLPGRLLLPVPADDAHKHSRRPFTPQLSYWERFTAWLRYNYIQTRWDIERRLARKLHRRWGDQL